MKICHWTLTNGSGMHRVASEISQAENQLGHASLVLSSFEAAQWPQGMDADIHVSHSHIPDPIRKNSKGKWVWVGHGTPEHCFRVTAEEAATHKYGHADCMMLIQWWLQNADAIVTFWPRHAEIWSSMCDKHTTVDCIPLGVDKTFWEPGHSAGKYVGAPSVFYAENCHDIKWPLDLVIMWGWVWQEIMDAQLHIIYLPTDQHRFWFPLINRNGCGFKTYAQNTVFGKPDLRNAFSSVDFVASFVRYGDFNRLSLEAKACGAKLISWAGNPYADYWILEGDQRLQKEQLVKILKGEVTPRGTDTVPDIMQTAETMVEVYKRILSE